MKHYLIPIKLYEEIINIGKQITHEADNSTDYFLKELNGRKRKEIKNTSSE